MRVLVTGGTGNVGTSVLERLARDPEIEEVVALARRPPAGALLDRTRFVAADVGVDDLVPHFGGMDAVVHLAWLIQPIRDVELLRRTNVVGTRRVAEACIAAGVGSLVYASSIGTYAPGPKQRRIDERWPATGVATSLYSRHKAEVEALLDEVEARDPALRIVRLRKALVFKRQAASQIGRYFIGPLVPRRLLQSRFVPVVPANPRLVLQVVHSADAAAAYHAALRTDVRGAFNIAAEPVLTPAKLGEVLGARPVPVPMRVLRAATAATFRLHLQPTEPGWIDLADAVPVMATDRARRELGWGARTSASDALRELLAGFAERAGMVTPPLEPAQGDAEPLRPVRTEV